MAALGNTNKQQKAVVAASTIVVGTGGTDTLTYNSGTAQELLMFNNSASPVVVTVKGSSASTVAVPGCGSATLSVAAGLPVSVPANGFAFVPLDAHSGYLAGASVTLTAATGAVVYACILQ